MLGRLKLYFTKKFESLGRALGRILSPNFFTGMALLLGILSGVIYGNILTKVFNVEFLNLNNRVAVLYGAVILFISGIFDGLDGLVARSLGKASKRGAFYDSLCDRIVDACVFFGLAYASYITWELAFIATILSQWISYVRSRGESLGIEMSGIGLMERQERVLYIILLSFLYYLVGSTYIFHYGVLLLAILLALTFLYRTVYVIKKL